MTPAAPAATEHRPVLCVTDHLHRDLALARDAQVGRFTHLGRVLDLGRRPDWFGGDPADVEWRIEWVKLYEGLDLAHAFAETGDVDLLATWEDLVESFLDQVPVGHDSSDVSARRVQNWLYAWQRFTAAPAYPGLRAGLEERLVERMLADAAHLGAHLTAGRNHRTLELYTLLLVGLALDTDESRARNALDLLAENAATDIWADGVHRECSTDYHLIVLRSLLGAVANARLAGLDVPTELLAAAERACDFALHVQRPDGITPSLSDGDQGDYRRLLTLGADLLDRADLRWAATLGRAGTPPAERLASFPVGGYHVQRSGWGERGRPYADERYGIFDCGPLGDGGHGHYDQLSVELFAGGLPLVVDPGRYTYADDETGWRHWFKGTAGHSTVCVDGLDQTPYRGGKPKGPVSTARLLGRWTRPGLDVLRGEVRSPQYDAVHTRTLAFVDDEYWVVHDRLRGDRAHEYAARWHLAATAQGLTQLRPTTGQTAVELPGAVLVVPAGFGAVSIEGGWVSPTYGTKEPAPVVLVRGAGSADADLVTVIVPSALGVEVSARAEPDRLEVVVRRPGDAVDTVWWSFDASGTGWERASC